MSRPAILPPLRATPKHTIAALMQMRSDGEALLALDSRSGAEMQDMFFAWMKTTAGSLEELFWSNEVADWFRTGTLWMAGTGSYSGIRETLVDRLQVLDEIGAFVSAAAGTSRRPHEANARSRKQIIPPRDSELQDSNRVRALATSLIAEWRRLDVRITGERHDYRLSVDVYNDGRTKIDDWRIQVWFPSAFIPNEDPDGEFRLFEDFDGHYSDLRKRLYPGDRLHVFDIDYFVNHGNWPGASFLSARQRAAQVVKIKVCAGDMVPWEATIPMMKLQNF